MIMLFHDTVMEVTSRPRSLGEELEVETASLRFVAVTAKSLKQHRSQQNTEEARHVRSHVMKDYLRRQNDVSKRHFSPAKSKLSDHIGRFRFSPKPARRGSRQVSETTKPKRDIAPPQKTVTRVLVPKAVGLMENPSPLPLPIDKSTPGTMTLLEYYHTSFWANSLAVNPEGKWISVALSDPAILHATLSLVALHKYQIDHLPLANSYFYHRGEAMRLIATYLNQAEMATSDNTIGAIAILSTSDNAISGPAAIAESHLNGLLTLVNLRGGIDGMNTNKHIKRVIAWADVLHAAAHNTLPQLGTSHCTASRDMRPLLNLVKRHGYSTVNLKSASDDIVPRSLQDIFQNIRLLAKAKPLLLHAKSEGSAIELKQIFSSVLFKTERRILQLGQGALLTNEYLHDGHDDGLETLFCAEATKAACLIFTYHGLRDLAITASFFNSLVSRLRDATESVLDHYREVGASRDIPDNEDPRVRLLRESGLPPTHLSFLIWLMLNGWKASGLKEDREWFAEKAGSVCEMAGITSVEAFGSRMRRVVFLPEYCLPAIKGLWAEIQAVKE